MLKKLLPLCLAAALLAGCGASAQKPAEPSDAAAPPAAVTQATAEQAAPGFTVGTLHPLGMTSLGEGDAINKDAYYEIAEQASLGGLILKTDYATGVQSSVCKRPGCTHDNAGCPAYLASTIRTSVAAVAGRVCVLYSGRDKDMAQKQAVQAPLPTQDPTLTPEEQAAADAQAALDAQPSFIEVVSADGTARTRLMEMPGKPLSYGWCDENAIYAVRSEALGSEHTELLRIALDGGGCSTVPLPLGATVAGVTGNRFLLNRIVSDQNLETLLQTGDQTAYQAALQNASSEYELWDMATGAAEKVYARGAADRYSLAGTYDGKLYFSESTADAQGEQTQSWLTEVNAADGSVRTLTEELPEKNMWPVRLLELGLPGDGDAPRGFLWMEATAAYTPDSNDYLIDLRDGSATRITQRAPFEDYYATAYPVAQTNDGRWMISAGGVTSAHNARSRYGLIDPADYLAGGTDYRMVSMYGEDAG